MIDTFISGGTKKGGKYTLDQIEVEDFRDSEEESKKDQSFSDISEPEVCRTVIFNSYINHCML